ncbi:vegetative cell wall protein gp1-like [Iris pallida]|uniref:Vegetative cell wall protein gp1-like n=1 Tax=Iris pallida TaxID=29817 RepID=A0AAX6DRT0_IRIPA|nr:vegetative cell wall protein gp1-like [Iris pallida]
MCPTHRHKTKTKTTQRIKDPNLILLLPPTDSAAVPRPRPGLYEPGKRQKLGEPRRGRVLSSACCASARRPFCRARRRPGWELLSAAPALPRSTHLLVGLSPRASAGLRRATSCQPTASPALG